ncbi:SIMPL domain-containing protein [Cognatilysobacter lacus]|nr:SIMPL domain-containing protein [Lysobacter lacus]
MRRLVASVLLIFTAGAAQAQVNALPPTRHILVYGDAQARAIPDRFRIKVDFDAVDRNAGEARRRVEASVASIVDRLHGAGVGDDDIVATSLSVSPKTHNDPRTDEQVFVGTEVERSLTARFDAKEKLEGFLRGLQTSKELSVSDITTELSDEPTLRKALRVKAIESTREKAETIAKAYGARLGALYSVSDVAPQFQYGISSGSWPAGFEWYAGRQELGRVEVTGSRIRGSGMQSTTALQSGYVTYTDRIYAVFLLAD